MKSVVIMKIVFPADFYIDLGRLDDKELDNRPHRDNLGPTEDKAKIHERMERRRARVKSSHQQVQVLNTVLGDD